MPRLLPRLLPLVVPLVLLACPTRRSATSAPSADDPESPQDASATASAEPEDSAALEAARRARLAHEARSMLPPERPNVLPPDAKTTVSGIPYQVLVEGTGPTPGPRDAVELLQAAWTMDGTPNPILTIRDEPRRFLMEELGPNFREALASVKEGGTARIWLPDTFSGPSYESPGGALLIQVTLTKVTTAPETPADVAGPPPDATITPSGLAFKVLAPGTGTVHPDPHDHVVVHYTGWTTDGRMFDDSRVRDRPSTFPVNRVIEGWTEGLRLMVVGERTRFWVPEALAYKGEPGKPAGMLVFDVELLEIDEQPEPAPPPPTPKSLKPPRNAKRTPSGLAYRVLTKGTGKEHPTPTSIVEVHYSGWTTDGKLFDSSVTRGKPTSFPLNRVIEGWSEGVQLMVVGEKTRFWIPEALAYQGRPGKPAGMLIFDVELLAIDP